ncbi:YaiO family outer membrane beta-barrel protein [Salmonella enterica]|uniref:YaiO family outer membrane beta-barrel protein n=1 Tax=Escherichia fergusonii TaxID=564 RepID=UPI001289C6D1|nr:YaiO family outer membrane beta-barrel protein [Escherichia fergusonii]EAW8382123.1 YaiO family outer membrane beta-barrel protein [Salmonella enterica]ECI6759086.1 YaiO family outer membrane beta-barrel protein [Salmonella enterica subsp. enterica serovar Mbandaka]EJC1536196.1 YaiO family outer membrane beta-barrel protein [Salmonella enterica subsp. enterica serovar Montevideo]EAY4988072.1 YaiO family outer membrane beta-barrel protein [Salmonella enterica]MBA8503771.1 YaiO family outer m
MNKYKFRVAALFLICISASVHAAGAGRFESSIAGAQVSGPYKGGQSFATSLLFNLEGKDKLGVSYQALNAWGESASYMNLRYVSYLSQDVWVDTNFGGSDKGSITARVRGSAMINRGFTDKGLIFAVGPERYTMRSGAGSSAVRTMAVRYLKDYPVALQLNTSLARSDMNHRFGGQVGVAVQYGHEDTWIVAGGGSYGRVHYESVAQPGTVADYRSVSYFVSGRYRAGDAWGLTTRYSGVTNHHYTRNEVAFGVFVDF